ncbi:MAG: HAMP domain-containing sensor histidine kinase [Campylobacterales bacterium]
MNRIELESFTKGFVLFFTSLSILVGVLFYFIYQKEILVKESELFTQMRICSLNLKCNKFDINFEQKRDDLSTYKLLKDDNSLYSLFNIDSSSKFLLKISFKKEKYLSILKDIKERFLLYYMLVLVVIVVLSVVFSLYTLNPLRKSLLLTEEFIKDILHDFNTPISSLKLNSYLLKKEIGENVKVLRIENSLKRILALQNNLITYLQNQPLQKEEFSLKEVVEDRVGFISKLYDDITFKVEVKDRYVNYNKEAFVRILDNLLSNASKYNKKDGNVYVTLDNNTLVIKDEGIGIKNTTKVFERFYKENQRGIGIGLHIVKKLCDELGIKIEIKSKIDVGTSIYLYLS